MFGRKKEIDLNKEREQMIQEQLIARGIVNERVLEAMRCVPRHLFVPESRQDQAYQDRPLPIGRGQTISQPFIVAYMTSLLELNGTEKVLEIGTGSGYQTAILCRLARYVFSVECIKELADVARLRLSEQDYDNVTLAIGDGGAGLPDEAPFDAILMTAASPDIPQPLRHQLADGGRLVGPVGSRYDQFLVRLLRHGEQWSQESFGPVIFVPLVGQHGWLEH